MSNKKKNKKTTAETEQNLSFKWNGKLVSRIMAGALAVLMVLGTITMTIMYFMEAFHAH